MRRAVVVLLLPVAGAACSAAPRATGTRPAPEAAVSTLFDAGSPFGAMGLLVAGPPLPFVATVRYLAAATPDSTLAVFAMSLANHSLTFQRDGRGYAAQYRVEVAFRGDTGALRQFATDEAVRVRTFQETARADESIIYQQSLALRPGVYRVAVTVRDRNGTGVAHVERADTAPQFGGAGLSTPIALYQGPGRTHRSDVPAFLVNPRATISYGADSLRFYVEAYGARRGMRLAARALDQGGREVWHDTLGVTGTDSLASTLAVLHPSDLPVGQGRLEVSPVDARPDAVRSTPFLVSFSDQFAITSYDQMISLLRYFERQDWVEKLRQAPPEQRPAVWRAFYTERNDSVAGTPVREALEAYFRRVLAANLRFRETGEPGWLTERGEVFVTLGEPDDVFDFSSDVSRAGVRGIRWTYNALRLTLFFQDQAGFGRFRLTPLSRAEFQRAVAQVRRRR
ncbi:MAG TPA: GWxTD domain-containing protein [Gemmatimonadales bacterium]|nr:GWxTD domain-containing protein [Gemmatimonadales bacterium]